MVRKCKFPLCGLKHYAKGYCRKHYASFCRGGYKLQKCKLKNCPYTTSKGGYCCRHQKSLQAGLPLVYPFQRKYRIVGIDWKNPVVYKAYKKEYNRKRYVSKHKKISLQKHLVVV